MVIRQCATIATNDNMDSDKGSNGSNFDDFEDFDGYDGNLDGDMDKKEDYIYSKDSRKYTFFIVPTREV